MKIMNKFQKKLANRKKDNKGFSLVELIIVIAIMAILVGIVGTQVIPYINKSKEAKDEQVLNSYSTAAVSAYSMLADKLKLEDASGAAKTTLVVKVYADSTPDDTLATTDEGKVANKIKDLIGGGYTDAKSKMTSTEGKKATEITITFNFSSHTVETVATGTELNTIKADI